jgi:hypothetical protein
VVSIEYDEDIDSDKAFNDELLRETDLVLLGYR